MESILVQGNPGSGGTANGYYVDDSPPFSLAGDNNGDYFPIDFTIGQSWSITCQALCEREMTSYSSTPVTMNFTVFS